VSQTTRESALAILRHMGMMRGLPAAFRLRIATAIRQERAALRTAP
jgi:hypothetical protein